MTPFKKALLELGKGATAVVAIFGLCAIVIKAFNGAIPPWATVDAFAQVAQRLDKTEASTELLWYNYWYTQAKQAEEDLQANPHDKTAERVRDDALRNMKSIEQRSRNLAP